jgi:hypothetical protein
MKRAICFLLGCTYSDEWVCDRCRADPCRGRDGYKQVLHRIKMRLRRAVRGVQPPFNF